MHECERPEEIGEIKASVKRLEKIVEGNGQPGLRDIVTALNTNVDIMNKNIAYLTTVISGILKFQNETEGESKERDRNKINFRWAMGLAITMFICLIGYIIKK
jgi:hypothetical protein